MSSAPASAAVPAVVKRYNKLIAKFLSWKPETNTASLADSHAALWKSVTGWPQPGTEIPESEHAALEGHLKTVEDFFRDVQVAQGLGKNSAATTGVDRKAQRQAENKARLEREKALGEDGAKKEKAAKEKKKHEESKEAPVHVKAIGELPEYIQHRASVWDRIAQRQKQAAIDANVKITVTLPDGKTVAGVAGVTSPMDIAKQLSVSKANEWLIAKIDDQQWDMLRPLENSGALTFYDFESKEGAHTFWHSSAHLLGQAIENEFDDVKLCVGPPLEEGGFYYDVEMGGKHLSQDDFPKLEATVNNIIRQKQTFDRLSLTKEEALEMFQYNKFKQEIIGKKVPDGVNCTAYRCGPLIDLCRGPHVPNSGYIKALAVTKASSAYWLGNAENESLQRVYGISFPNEKRLEDWQEHQRQAEERDHRRIGLAQKLFFFHELSPGSCFFLPHGTRVYNGLVNYIREEYSKRGYTEVISPNVFNIDLWKQSGHYDNYKENMFLFECEHQEFGLKPMNCPGHCLMFAAQLHSYRELPLRYADFGVLHRNEASGALTGLTRVRRFQQDDAHIFCRVDQIQHEVRGVLDMLESVYGVFGFHYSLALSTRPEKFLGEKEVWDSAEKALEESLNAFIEEKNAHDKARYDSAEETKGNTADDKPKFKPMSWSLNPGDGAFYGPKIDIQLTDALNRKHQCATVQLDFQLPIRFDLHYKHDDSSMTRPVIIHRAILGSVERMMAVLIEHTGGKWPLWISPRQIAILPVNDAQLPYAEQVQSALHADGYYCEIDATNSTLNKKILKAQIDQFNLILVLGAKEVEGNTVTVRWRDEPKKLVTQSIDQFRAYVKEQVASKR